MTPFRTDILKCAGKLIENPIAIQQRIRNIYITVIFVDPFLNRHYKIKKKCILLDNRVENPTTSSTVTKIHIFFKEFSRPFSTDSVNMHVN